MDLPTTQRFILEQLMSPVLLRAFRNAHDMPLPQNRSTRLLSMAMQSFALGTEMKSARHFIAHRHEMVEAARREMGAAAAAASQMLEAMVERIEPHAPCLVLSGLQRGIAQTMIDVTDGSQVQKLVSLIGRHGAMVSRDARTLYDMLRAAALQQNAYAEEILQRRGPALLEAVSGAMQLHDPFLAHTLHRIELQLLSSGTPQVAMRHGYGREGYFE